MQKQSDPSFFLTKTTALHQGLLLGWTTPASNINFKCSLTSSTWGGGILWKCSLNGGVSGSLRTIWYSHRRPCTFSACSVGQASKPDKSSLSRSKTCHSASVRVGCSLGLSAEMVSITRGT